MSNVAQQMTGIAATVRGPDVAWFRDTVSCRVACPVGTDAAAYVMAVSDGRYDDAYDIARARNPLPSICGRVCSAPCERACRRNVIYDPVAIRAIKRFVTSRHGAESDSASRWHRAHAVVPPATLASVGIVGAGPAGLSAAYELRLAGHDVTIYERDAQPGGMMAFGIPAFRLPADLVASEVNAILSLGITLHTSCEVGRDVSMAELRERHAAVLVTVGCARGRALTIAGVELTGVSRAIDVLRETRLTDAVPTSPGAVVVIGGGSVAFDAARTARRASAGALYEGQAALDAARSLRHTSAQPVIMVAPESRADLRVDASELAEAEHEGVIIRGATGVRRIEGNGHVERVVLAPVEFVRDSTGRAVPQLVDGRDETFAASRVIMAVGQESDTQFLTPITGESSARGRWGGLVTDSDGRTDVAGLYGAGDVATGPRDLIDAVASGQRAARAIHADLSGIAERNATRAVPGDGEPLIRLDRVAPARRFWTGYTERERASLPLLPTVARTVTREVEDTLSESVARAEAARCLHCTDHVLLDAARCIACGGCVDVCPYACLSLHAYTDGGPSAVDEGAAKTFTLDLDERACIRCGLCVDRCPTSALWIARAVELSA